VWILQNPSFFRQLVRLIVLVLGLLSFPLMCFGHEPPAEEDVITLPEVAVHGERPLAASSERVITEQDIKLVPIDRPGNLLRLVPGLVTLNPSGGPGKADNFLLRGFDADHGTDVAAFLDGMPINLRSHAHGQGWLDLSFLIPETMKAVEVNKGPYQVQYGDFATAGAINFVTRDVVEEGVVQVTGGQFSTQRHLLMFSPSRDRVRSLVAVEGFYTNGPFLNDLRAPRFNGLVKLSMNPTARSELSLTGTQYVSRWNASGQIPLREVQVGRLDRFGAIDPSEGGRTQRSTGHLRYHYDTAFGGTAFAEAYFQYYRMDIFTNFTFFLDNPINGDGIEQNDRRYLYGGDIGYRQGGEIFGVASAATFGVQSRVDDIDVRLGTQRRRMGLSTTSDSAVHEASYSPYLKLELQPTGWMRFVGGTRADFFQFKVTDRCPVGCLLHPQGQTTDVITSTKGNLILGPWFGTELFINAGTGFHSNDARAVVSNPTIQTLPRATGYEIGVRTRQWNERIELTASLWTLDLSSELVFNGDTGTTDIRGASRRYGIEVGTRVRPLEWLTFAGDVTFAHAEFRETGQAIPQAPLMTGTAEMTARLPNGFAASLRMFHLGPRPLVEDRSVNAQPFTVFNFAGRYRPPSGQWRQFEVFLSIENLLNSKWRQTQLFYESRLATEPAPVGDIHFTPGMPRMVMGGVAWYF